MSDFHRFVTSFIANFTIAPLLMAFAAWATGADPDASFIAAFVLFWPALLANAGIHAETTAVDRRDKPRLVGAAITLVEFAVLPILVLSILWLNPSIALLLQNTKGWVLGAAAAGGSTRLLDALRTEAMEIFAPKAEVDVSQQ